jgi:DNA repair exonuclease SbcCD ATPase subunit
MRTLPWRSCRGWPHWGRTLRTHASGARSRPGWPARRAGSAPPPLALQPPLPLPLKTMMPLINSELQRLLQDSAYFKLEVRISDKNEVEFVMIDNSTGIEKLMVSGSGYEKTIASLALRAVLSKICSLPKPNIIVFDEVFGKISNDNLEMVGEFFTKIKEYFEKIFVITHNPLVSNWSDNIVKIKKEDNISKVSQ